AGGAALLFAVDQEAHVQILFVSAAADAEDQRLAVDDERLGPQASFITIARRPLGVGLGAALLALCAAVGSMRQGPLVAPHPCADRADGRPAGCSRIALERLACECTALHLPVLERAGGEVGVREQRTIA